MEPEEKAVWQTPEIEDFELTEIVRNGLFSPLANDGIAGYS